MGPAYFGSDTTKLADQDGVIFRDIDGTLISTGTEEFLSV